MQRLLLAILVTAAGCAAQGATGPLPLNFVDQALQANATQKSQIVIPAETTVALALTRPVWAKTAKPGDSIYAQTVFPVAINNQMAIPAGTYVEGQIDSLSRPGWLSPHAQFQIHFTKLIFANGYTVAFGGLQNLTTGQSARQQAPAAVEVPADENADVIPAVANPYVEVSRASDILLDNGSQIEMVLQIPLALDQDSVTDAVRQSHPAQLIPSKSATLCRPTPGTPGSSDTVIPGTPGTPGTPDTVIPSGMPGVPDTVIPGIPATPGTPDTIIPGTPGTPGTLCPGPPLITSSARPLQYKKSFQINAPMQVDGKQLTAGDYQLTWAGGRASAQVDFIQNGNVVARVPARIVMLDRKSSGDLSMTRAKADGSLSLQSLRFGGESFALYFDSNTQ